MKPVKFTFDTAFDVDPGEAQRAEKEVLRQRLDSARTEGQTSGFEAGRARAMEELDAKIAATLDTIAQGCRALLDRHHELEARLTQQAAQLAFAIAAKLAPTLMRAHPLAEIEAVVGHCMQACQQEPRIVVRAAEHLVDNLRARLDGLKLNAGFAGEIVLLGDPAIGEGDCRVEWPDGGVERSTADLMAAVEEAVQRFVLEAPQAPAGDGRPDPTGPTDQE